MTKLVDMRGSTFYEGCTVARAVSSGNTPYIYICEVREIRDGRLYLNDSKQPLRYPGRLLIIDKDPLIKMLEQYEKSKENESPNGQAD